MPDRLVDPAILDEPIEPLPVELEAPSWLLIVFAWAAGIAFCAALWGGAVL